MFFQQDKFFCFSPSQRKTKTGRPLRSQRLCGENKAGRSHYPYLLSYYENYYH